MSFRAALINDMGTVDSCSIQRGYFASFVDSFAVKGL
jgi:hypothetical protein